MMIRQSILLVFAFCLFVPLAHADFTMTPSADFRLEYNDNIFLENDKEDDFIATMTPNVSLTWELPNLALSLDGGLVMEKYLDNTDEDDIRPRIDQPTELDILLSLYKDIVFLGFTDTYSLEVIDEGGSSGEGNRTVNLTSTNRLRVNPYLLLPYAKGTEQKIGYAYENLWYEEDEGNDSESHIFSTTLTHELSPRITSSLDGSYTLYRPKDADSVLIDDGDGGIYDYDRKSVSLGLSYQISEQMTVQGSYGHTWLDYNVREDADSSIWSASLDYQISSAYTVGTAYSNDYVVSAEDGPSDSERLSAYIKYEDRYTLKATVFASDSDFVEIDRSYDSYGADLTGELPLTEKMGVTGLLRYTNFDETGESPQEYDRYSVRFTTYYDTRLGRLSGGYIYNENDSNQDHDDYTNNIVYLDFSWLF